MISCAFNDATIRILGFERRTCGEFKAANLLYFSNLVTIAALARAGFKPETHFTSIRSLLSVLSLTSLLSNSDSSNSKMCAHK